MSVLKVLIQRSQDFTYIPASIRQGPVVEARKLGVTVGPNCRFISTTRATFGSEPYLVNMGEHITITAGVRFLKHDEGVWVVRRKSPELDIIKPVCVGDNVAVAAGGVVTRDIPGDSVWGGVPAKFIKSLDDYRRSAEPEAIPTKGFSAIEKQQYLLRRFK